MPSIGALNVLGVINKHRPWLALSFTDPIYLSTCGFGRPTWLPLIPLELVLFNYSDSWDSKMMRRRGSYYIVFARQ